MTPGDIYVSNCRALYPNCPEVIGPDVDFGSPPMLARVAPGRDLIVIGQKSRVGYALDPDFGGRRVGSSSVLGNRYVVALGLPTYHSADNHRRPVGRLRGDINADRQA